MGGASDKMHIERLLRLIGGFFVMLSTALGYFHSPYWLIFTAFVGLNLFQSGFTDWCPMVWFLRKAGFKRCRPEGEKPEDSL